MARLRPRALGALTALLLTAAPAHAGQIVLESEPSGAEVYLDGKRLGRTPLLAAEVPDGTHEVELRHPGYQTGHMTVRVLRDLTTRRQVQLSRQGASGELRVTSEPLGAQVILGGRPVGRTPLHLRRVTPGEHTVVLRRPGYRDEKRTIRVVADLTTARHLPLRVEPPAPKLAQRPVPERPRAVPVRPIEPKTARRLEPKVVTALPRRPVAKAPHAVPTAPPRVLASAPPAPEASPAPLVPVRPVAPERSLPWKHVAFYGAMGMFLAMVAGYLWQRREPPTGWQDDKPLARFQPLTPGCVPMAAVECCLRSIRLVQAGQAGLGAETMLAAYRQAPGVQMVYNLALAWHLSGSALAETAYRTAIQLDPSHRDARFNLAKLLADSGRPYEALLAYRKLLALAPDDGNAWFNLGTLQARLGMAPEAIAALRRARRILGDDPACRHNLRLARKLAPWWGLGAWRPPKHLVAASQ